MVDVERLGYFLDRARNGLGQPITAESRARLLAAVREPCHETWNQAHGVVIGGPDRMTLWIALAAILTPPRRPRAVAAYGRARWVNIPSGAQVAAAIRYATS